MNKPLPDDTKVSVARLCTAAEKLLQETERLRRDVVALNQRVQPIEEQGPGAAGSKSHRQSAKFGKQLML